MPLPLASRATARRGPALLVACLGAALPVHAQSREPRPQPWALVGARLGTAEDAPAKTILLRGGRVVDLLEPDAELPAGWRVLEAEDLLAVPAFVDAWTTSGCAMPEPVVEQDRPAAADANVHIDMRAANRKGIRPSFRAVEVLDLGNDVAAKHRAQGFGALASSPGGELLAGWSVLATTRDAATRDVVLRGELSAHAAFAARGPGYPGTLMGYHAQIRQYFLDVRHHQELERRREQGRPGPRPAFDRELVAGRALLAGGRLVCEANRAPDIARWMRLAGELGIEIAISGGREAWKLAEELGRRRIPVYLDLAWSDEPKGEAKEEGEGSEGEVGLVEEGAKEGEEGGVGSEEVSEEQGEGDWVYEEPEGVRVEKRRLWEEERDCAKRLLEAGVRFAFCTGEKGAKDLLANVRKLVESGFPAREALLALTEWPAEMVGAQRELGALEPGRLAAVGLWNGDPLAKDSQLRWLFVDGFRYEFEIEEKKKGTGEAPAEGVDVSGEWVFDSDSENEQEPARVSLAMEEDGSVTGEMTVAVPGGEKVKAGLTGRLEGTSLTLEGALSVQGLEIAVTFEAELEGDELTGKRRLKSEVFEDEASFVGTRVPDGQRRGARRAARSDAGGEER